LAAISNDMQLNLSTLAVVLGLGMGLPQIYGILKPSAFAAGVRKFPRSVPIGMALMLLGTGWFVFYLSQESISDFEAYKPFLLAGFAGVGIASCFYVQDFLAVRGLAVVFLLLAKLMVDTAHLAETNWRLVIVSWGYVLVAAGMWFTIYPWHLRDLLNWATANEKRVRVGSVIRLAFGLFVAALGFTVFRSA
jgi:predicted DNA-binding transcriptional regulator AlpA